MLGQNESPHLDIQLWSPPRILMADLPKFAVACTIFGRAAMGRFGESTYPAFVCIGGYVADEVRFHEPSLLRLPDVSGMGANAVIPFS